MEAKKISLKQTQTLLWSLIKAPEGVIRALSKKRKSLLPIKANKKLAPEQRLDIYANMYFYRIKDALKSDYPALYKILGEVHFHNLITDFLLKYPSRFYSLRYTGAKLPSFLKSHPLNKKKPYLSEIAHFEWSMINAFDAKDENLLTEDDLKSIPPQQWGNLILYPISALYIQNALWPIKLIYEKGLKSKMKPLIEKEKTYLRVWRNNFKIYYSTMSKTEYLLIKALIKKDSFGTLCEKASKWVGEEKAASTVVTYLKTWLNDGILAKPNA